VFNVIHQFTKAHYNYTAINLILILFGCSHPVKQQHGWFTVAKLPGEAVLLGLTVLDQGSRVAAVPGVVRGPEQRVQTEDQLQPGAVGEGGQQVHRIL